MSVKSVLLQLFESHYHTSDAPTDRRSSEDAGLARQLHAAQALINSQQRQLDVYEHNHAQAAITLREHLKHALDVTDNESLLRIITDRYLGVRSHRGIPLFYSRESIHVAGCPTVTVEDYPQWFSVYVVQPDGKVETATQAYPDQWDEAVRITEMAGMQFHGAHCWHPFGLRIFAQQIDGTVDRQAIHALTYRWITEERGTRLDQI